MVRHPQMDARVPASTVKDQHDLLGGACTFAVSTYSLRFRRPDRGPLLLDSWQSQVRAIALLAALPLGALGVALILPLGAFAAFLAMGITLVAAVVLLVGHVSSAVSGASSRAT